MNAPAPLPPFPVLETPRLVLREIVPADAPALFGIHGDAAYMRWFGSESLRVPDDAIKLAEMFAGWRSLPNPGTRWALELKDTPGLIGTAGVFGWHRAWHKCLTGFEIDKAHAGQGLMREALGAIFNWSFATMALNRIEAQIHPDNLASRALAERLGFKEEGLLREVGFWAGAYHDLVQYGLLRRDWLAPRRA